jgi:hypothetical protein
MQGNIFEDVYYNITDLGTPISRLTVAHTTWPTALHSPATFSHGPGAAKCYAFVGTREMHFWPHPSETQASAFSPRKYLSPCIAGYFLGTLGPPEEMGDICVALASKIPNGAKGWAGVGWVIYPLLCM